MECKSGVALWLSKGIEQWRCHVKDRYGGTYVGCFVTKAQCERLERVSPSVSGCSDVLSTLKSIINESFATDDAFFPTAPRLAPDDSVRAMLQPATHHNHPHVPLMCVLVSTEADCSTAARAAEVDCFAVDPCRIAACVYLNPQHNAGHPEHAAQVHIAGEEWRLYVGLLAIREQLKRRGIATYVLFASLCFMMCVVW